MIFWWVQYFNQLRRALPMILNHCSNLSIIFFVICVDMLKGVNYCWMMFLNRNESLALPKLWLRWCSVDSFIETMKFIDSGMGYQNWTRLHCWMSKHANMQTIVHWQASFLKWFIYQQVYVLCCFLYGYFILLKDLL